MGQALQDAREEGQASDVIVPAGQTKQFGALPGSEVEKGVIVTLKGPAVRSRDIPRESWTKTSMI